MRTVLFVCTGNYYRSRFSEVLFNRIAAREGLDWRADSRGLMAWLTDNLGPISPYALEGLEARGIHLNGETRSPRQLEETDLDQSDLVIALKEAEHRPMFREQFPEWADRVEYWAIDDLDCAEPEDALACLEAAVRELAGRLAAETAAR